MDKKRYCLIGIGVIDLLYAFFNKVNIVMRDSAPDGTYSAFCTDAGYEIYII